MDDLKRMAAYGKTPTLKKLTLMFSAMRLEEATVLEIKQKFEEAD